MNHELKDLIERVKASDEPVREVVNQYMARIGWSLLKNEWNRMTETEQKALINKLESERG